MSNQAIRARIERLIRRDFRAADLSTIFLYARERCDGREPVREIGDFVAHQNERTKGVITRSVRDWCLVSWFHILYIQRAINPKRLRSDFPDFLEASFKRIEHGDIKKATGLRRVDASRLLPSLIGKFRRNDDGTLSVSILHTKDEIALLNCLCGTLVAKPAFDNDRLFSDLIAILVNNGDLQKSEISLIAYIKPAVGLFAITCMHNCTIDIGNGSKIMLGATDNAISAGDLGIVVAAPVLLLRSSHLPANTVARVPGRSEGAIMLGTAMFSTGLNAKQYCTDALIASTHPWSSMTLEVTDDMRLGILS